ncbi:hypothetical protein EDD22DRAFT_847642 [Suillus occidentalis]|nr:hypothetical protein EDD22DRAFT_847642 [Suillus occidentalis]
MVVDTLDSRSNHDMAMPCCMEVDNMLLHWPVTSTGHQLQQEQPYESIPRPQHNQQSRVQVLEACGQPQPNDSNKFVYGPTQANSAACDPRPLPVTVAPQPQKRGREEYHGNLLEDGDSVKKIKKTENDTPLTQTSSEIRASKGSKRKAIAAKLKTKVKTKIEGEQAMAHLQEQSHWSDEDTKLLLKTLLGGDSEFYEGLTGNAKHIFKKSITGNGGGDPDVEVLDEKIENAQTAGKDIGNLSGATLKKWYDEGWYALFNDRLDTINISSEEGSDGESKDSDMERKSDKKVKPMMQKGVPAPRHKRKASQTGIGNEAAKFFCIECQILEGNSRQ